MGVHRALVVTDDALEAGRIAESLRTAGWEAHPAANAQQAAESLKAGGIDLVVTGPQALGHVVPERRGSALLVLASPESAAEALEGTQDDLVDLVCKPAHMPEIQWRAQRLVRLRDSDTRLLDRLLSSEIAFDEFEKELLKAALRRTDGNQTRAARLLGLTRRTLQYRIEKHGVKGS